MPSLSEIFGAPAAPKAKLSFGEIFGAPQSPPPAPFASQVSDFLGQYEPPGVPQYAPEPRDQFLTPPPVPDGALEWEEIAAKHQDEWTNGAVQVDAEPFRLAYERETDPQLKTEYWRDWQNVLQKNETRKARIDSERAEMESLGLTPEQYWQKQLYDAEQNSEGVNRLGNAGPLLGLKNAVTAVPSVIAEGVLRGTFADGAVRAINPALADAMKVGRDALMPQAEQMADQLARTRADDEAYSQYADKMQGAPSKYARQVTEMLTKYVPIGATTGPAGLTPFIFTEAQSGAYAEGKQAGLKGKSLDLYANGIGVINAGFTLIGGKIAQKFGAGTIEEFGAQGIPLSTGVKDFLKKYAVGAASETLAEEVPTYLAENYARYLAGVSEDAIPETWQQDLVDIAVVSTLAQSASSLSHIGDDTRQFLENPSVETAKKAGVPEELVQSREDAESLAVQVADEIAEKSTEAATAPETPVDEVLENPTLAPEVPTEVAQERAPASELPLEQTLPVQVDSGLTAGGEISPPQEAPRKRRLGERIVPDKPGVYTGQTETGSWRTEIKPSIGQRLREAVTGKPAQQQVVSEDAVGNLTIDAPFRVKEPTPSVAPPDAPPVAPSQAAGEPGVAEVVAPTVVEPPKKKAQRQPQLAGLPEDLDENVLEGQRGLFESQASANTGEQLQPSKPKVIVTPPKSQRQIIAELSKALDIPIRFGRQLDRKAGGLFYRAQNIITSKFANDVPVVTHEVGHKLDSMFELSRDKTIKAELEKLGDPSTPGSRSSWTKSKSGVYKRGEGMAEFVRYWMTDPQKAKADAPGTYDAFEAVLDANKDLGDSMRQAQEDIRLWRTAEPQARLRSQISVGENPNKTRYSLSQLTRDLVDDLHYLRLASEDAKLGDPDLPPSKNPYLLARNLRGSYGMASTFIQSGAVDFKSKDVALGTSLEDALKPVGGRINDFRDWIVAKRAQELERQGRATGMVRSDIEGVVKKFDGDQDFEKAFSDLKRWNDSVLQYAVDAGLVTKESAENIRKMNQDYVPFHRLFEVGANEAPSSESTGKGSGLNAGKPGSLKRLKGSQRNIVDPLETMVKNAYAIITASEKSAISLAVADMAKLPNMGRWVEKVAGPMKETRFSVNDIRDQLEDMGADLEGIDKKGGDDMLSVFRQATRPPKGENTISVVRDGKTEFYRLNRYLHDTFEALDLDDAGKLVRMLSAPAQVLRAGVTLEPGFNLANMMRDTVGAAVVGKYGALPFETTIRGIAALANNPQLVAEWAASGGRSSVEANYFDRKKMQKYLAERIAKDLTPAERALIVAKSPLAALRWMATTFEEATRIGEYQKAYDSLKQSGMADGEARRLAAFEARDRQDFAKGGAKTKILRHVAAFWNAQLQANVRLAQAFKEKPLETTMKGLAFVTLPKLIEQALNWDDEDYWERPQWERDLFYMIPVGKDDADHTKFLRIPTPFEIGIIFGTIPGRFLQWAKENNPDAVKDLPGFLLKQTIPVPNPSGAVTAMELIPDQGYSYFRGREIVPDSMADMPKDLQWTAQTSTLAKKIGQATGISPMKIDYFIESTTGGTGKVALGKQVPGERFVTNPLAVTGQPIADFYAIRDQLKEDSERLKATGEHAGLGPVMLSEFEDAGEKIGSLRNKSREETDPIKKAALEDEAYQMTREMVQRYRANPEPEEAVQKYAEKQAKKVVLSSDRPVQKKKKLGSKEPAETDEEYQKRLSDWEEGRDASEKWLRQHKDSPAVQAAIKEAAKDIPPFPQYKGKLDVRLGAKRAEWRAKYGSSAELLKSLE